MRLGITSNKMTHCNINHYFNFHSSLQSKAAKDVLLAALLVGSILHRGAKLMPGRGQCCTPQHLLESGRWSLTQEIWIRTLVKTKSTDVHFQLNCWLSIGNNIIPSPIPSPLSGGLVYVLAFIAKFSFQFCTQRHPRMYFLSLPPKKFDLFKLSSPHLQSNSTASPGQAHGAYVLQMFLLGMFIYGLQCNPVAWK